MVVAAFIAFVVVFIEEFLRRLLPFRILLTAATTLVEKIEDKNLICACVCDRSKEN